MHHLRIVFIPHRSPQITYIPRSTKVYASITSTGKNKSMIALIQIARNVAFFLQFLPNRQLDE
jgi:hypothetical protein